MHAITRVHFEGRHISRVWLHQVRTDGPSGFDLDDGHDASAVDVAALLNKGRLVRVAVVNSAGDFEKGGVVSRDIDGELMAVMILGSNMTKLEALPAY